MAIHMADIKEIVIEELRDNLGNIARDISERIMEDFKSHMEDQPYRATCKECGGSVDVAPDLDKDNDLILEVMPCSCQNNDSESIKEKL